MIGFIATSDRKTAGAVERTIPQSILLRTDEVIRMTRRPLSSRPRCPGRLPRAVRSRQRRRCAAAGIAAAHRGPPRGLLTREQGGAGVPAGATGRGLRRGTRCGDRVAIRQRRLRSGTGVGRRPGPAQSRRDRRGQYARDPGGEARHVHHPHRHGHRRRSSRIRPGREPRASWRKRHRALDHDDRAQRQAAATAQGGDPTSSPGSQSCGIQTRRTTRR